MDCVCTLPSKNAFLQKTGLVAACLTTPDYELPQVCHILLAASARGARYCAHLTGETVLSQEINSGWW